MSNTLTKLSLVMGVLGLGFSSVAKADMKWVETLRGFCPTVCQEKAADKYNKENAAYKFAVPSGINPLVLESGSFDTTPTPTKAVV